ncbi:MAG: SDR family oxidoreductase [Bacteroidetes bacterium]|nr:SDR family oxidoreductase [Bacteroidota bacterium]
MKKKTALVGGSSAGIGKAIAIGLLEKGVDVIIIGRSSRLNDTKLELQKQFPSATIHAIETDYSSADSVNNLIQSVEKLSISLDILILNTGGPKAGSFQDISLEDWDQTYQQQFKSSMMLMKTFVPTMQKKKWGRIISVSSSIAIEPTVSMILSASYRAMLINALKSTSILIAKDGVTINTICPGAVMTDRLISLFQQQANNTNKPLEEIIKNAEASIPMQKIATAKEFAQLAVFLSSEESGYITGTVIPIDGGLIKKSF